jgi:hypothetical protein
MYVQLSRITKERDLNMIRFERACEPRSSSLWRLGRILTRSQNHRVNLELQTFAARQHR